jgi:hypothetical protein
MIGKWQVVPADDALYANRSYGKYALPKNQWQATGDSIKKVPAQPVDATPLSFDPTILLIVNRSFGLHSIRPEQGSVPFESTLANELA